MSNTIQTRAVGMIRIYMKPRDTGRGEARGWFRSAPLLYRQLIEGAKAQGIMNAVAHHTHYGYSNHGAVQAEGYEEPNPLLTCAWN